MTLTLKHFIPLFPLVLVALTSCASSDNNSGGTLDEGKAVAGIVKNVAAEAQPGVLVRLVVVNDTGDEVSELDRAISDEDGRFDFQTEQPVGSSVLARAELPEGALRTFAAGDGQGAADIGPVSDAVVSAVLLVTAPPGGRSLSDFARAELQTVAQAVAENLDPTALDLADTPAVLTDVIEAAGRTIPDAAGGEISAISSAAFEPADAVSDAPDLGSAPPCGRLAFGVMGDLFEFILKEDGALCDAAGVLTPLYSSYEAGYELSVVDDTFVDSDLRPEFFPGDISGGIPARFVEDSREYVFGPATTAAGLRVTRKVYIPEGADYARFLEIWSNPTASSATFSFRLTGSFALGTSGTPPIVLTDDTGDRRGTSDDDWVVYEDVIPSDVSPTVGLVWNGPGAGVRADTVVMPPDNANAFVLGWSDVPLAAGETKTFVYFTRVLTTLVADDAKTAMAALYESPDLTGLNSSELSALQNFRPNRGNVTGEAGSVVSGTSVGVTVGASTTTGQAAADGSFTLLVSAAGGETCAVTTGDGWSANVTVP